MELTDIHAAMKEVLLLQLQRCLKMVVRFDKFIIYYSRYHRNPFNKFIKVNHMKSFLGDLVGGNLFINTTIFI